MGDCRVSDFQKVKEITGHSACYIGGHCECPEEEEIWDKDYKDGNIEKWHKQIKSLVFHIRG